MIPFFRFIQFISAVRIIVFLTGTSFGIYERWQHHSSDRGYVAFGTVASICYGCSFFAYVYGYKKISTAVVSFWNGTILCMFSFTPIAYDHLFVSLQDLNTTDILLLMSVFIKCFKILMERICGKATYSPNVLSLEEIFLLIGYVSASTLTGKEIQFALLAVALVFTVTSFHLKSSLSLLNGLVFAIVTHEWFFPVLGVKYNPFCVLVFILDLCFEPIVDMFFSPLSTVERWHPLFNSAKWKKRCCMFLLIIVECLYLAFSSHVVYGFEKFFYRLPFFIVAVLIWISFHTLFFITCWGFFAKVEECYSVIRQKNDFSDSSISEVFASKGVRHFCLISHMVMFSTLGSTIIIGGLSLQGGNEYLIALLLIVLSKEHILYSLLRSLGRMVGGTAIGYALVTPTYSFSHAGEVILLANTSYQSLTTSAMSLLKRMTQFFSDHMIHNFGTDFSTSGITEEYVQGKLKLFFAQDVIPGVNFDTYILYFSGQTHTNGDWALTNDHTLTFEMIMKWWQRRNSKNGARLILVLDSVHSHQWINKVNKLDKEYIAIQSAIKQTCFDEEKGNINSSHGGLTHLWLDFNSSDRKPDDYWDKTHLMVKPIYSVSKNWCSFCFHEPTDDDISYHVEKNFPNITKPFIRIAQKLPWSLSCPVFCICDSLMKCLRRAKMKWFPPLLLDTGHGFKLVTVH